MKRSEVLVRIADQLRYRDEDQLNGVAEDILKELEKIGMLPPRTILVPLGLPDNAWDQE